MNNEFDNLNQEAEPQKEDILPEEPSQEEEEQKENQVDETEEEGSEIPEKFRGKSAEEIAKSYMELEKKMGQASTKQKSEAEEKAKEAQEHYAKGDTEKGRKAQSEMEEIIKKINKEIDETDYTKMDPKAYGKMMIEKQREMAEAVMNRDRSMRQNIQSEVATVAKDFPILRESSERANAFKELVIDIVSAGKSRGEDIGLRQAVEKANRAMGGIGTQQREEKKEPVKQQEKPKQKPRPVEKTQPTTPGKNDSEEERVKKGILSAGQGPGGLKGL